MTFPTRRTPARVRSLALLAPLAMALALAVGLLAPPAHAAAGDRYSAPLGRAIADLAGHREVRLGYDRDLFRHWVDADGDGCDTRDEVLIAEATRAPQVGSGCSLTGGRWFSWYDGESWTDTGRLDIDHLVPLAEAWDSGARRWAARTREAYANDLGDRRTLVAVTDSVNASKSDRDPSEWLPEHRTCRYVRQWVAVKHRWRLSVDRAERRTLRSLASGCRTTTVRVTLAR